MKARSTNKRGCEYAKAYLNFLDKKLKQLQRNIFFFIQDLKEKKQVEEAENGKDVPANGNAVSFLNFLYLVPTTSACNM